MHVLKGSVGCMEFSILRSSDVQTILAASCRAEHRPALLAEDTHLLAPKEHDPGCTVPVQQRVGTLAAVAEHIPALAKDLSKP